MFRRLILPTLLVAGTVVAACSQPPRTSPNPDCVPSVPAYLVTPGDQQAKLEGIIEYLTGERPTGDLAVFEGTVEDPNFGGVWGDRWGGFVVAVLDCSKVDADTLAEIAGGSEKLKLIEVEYTYRQLTLFRDTLVLQVNELGIDGEVAGLVDPGGPIVVYVPESATVPRSFGSGVPDDAYRVVRVESP